MEQSIGHGSMVSTMFSQTEWEVAQSLLLLSPTPFTWGCKRMRSAIQIPHRGAGHGGGGADVTPSCNPMMMKTEALSLATPLSFLTTQTDKNLKPLRKKLSFKRKREDHLTIIEDLAKANAVLNKEIDTLREYDEPRKVIKLKLKAKEIDTVRQYDDPVKDIKLKLKARGDKVQSFTPSSINYHFLQPSNGPKSELKNPSHVNASINSFNSMAEHQWHKQMQMPSTSHYPPTMMMRMLNQTFGSSQICSNVGVTQFHYSPGHPTMALPMPFSSTGAKGKVNGNTCPLAIPYINLLPSSQPFDEIIAKKDLNINKAAQARQRRIQILKLKNSIRKIKQHSS